MVSTSSSSSSSWHMEEMFFWKIVSEKSCKREEMTTYENDKKYLHYLLRRLTAEG